MLKPIHGLTTVFREWFSKIMSSLIIRRLSALHTFFREFKRPKVFHIAAKGKPKNRVRQLMRMITHARWVVLYGQPPARPLSFGLSHFKSEGMMEPFFSSHQCSHVDSLYGRRLLHQSTTAVQNITRASLCDRLFIF